jgi:hypothetical protein
MADMTQRASSRWWQLLLILPFLGVLWVPLFNKAEPELIGIPFFFWYQFLWVFVSAAITALVYRKSSPPPAKARAAKP